MVAGLPEDSTFIRLCDYTTTFWRYQHYDATCLATVESIYYFYKELLEAYEVNGVPLKNPVNIDDLMLLYAVQFRNMKSDVEITIKETGQYVGVC